MRQLKQLFAYPFRIFFLTAAVWAIVVVALWALYISGVISLPLAYPALQWHRHEMLFAFINPAIAGFLLTAVCVWTGTDRLHGFPLFLLWLLWLGGRLLTALGGSEMAIWSTLVNLVFLPAVAVDAGRRIWAARQKRQLIVLIVIALLWLMEMGMLVDGSAAFTAGALVLASVLMLVIGGRITPAFSANWLRGRGGDPAKVRVIPALEITLLVVLALLLIAVLMDISHLIAIAALAAAIVAAVRILLWRIWLVRAEPLLWILHLSLLWIPLALLLLAGHQIFGWPVTAWQHALGIGAMGGLILGVMTRVSLGHTGRPLVLPAGMVAAYWLIQLAALIRLLTVFAVISWQWGISLTAIAWVLAYGLFCWRYTAVLISPRVDGKAG